MKKANLEKRIKQALKEDFGALYQKEFTTDWKVQNTVRSLEIEVMGISNLLSIIFQELKRAEKEMGKALRMKYMVAHAGGNGEGFNIAVNRFNQAINNYLERRK